jgi:hypothetical protein
MIAARAGRRNRVDRNWRECLRSSRRQNDRWRNQPWRWRGKYRRKSGIVWTREWGGEMRLRVCLAHHRRHLLGYGAMMRAVTPAACWQICVLAAGNRRQRSQPEDQNEQNGEAAPHLGSC